MDNFTSDRFSVIYRIHSTTPSEIKRIADDITVEQTVEIPADCIPRSHFDEGIVGRVESLVDHGNELYDVEISFRNDVTSFTIPQFLNVIYGNISLKKGIRILDVKISPELSRVLPGPAWGIEGIRSLIGIYGRPLACTALKPMGLPVEQLALKAEIFTLGGIDIIKDDHGINDQHFHPFKERVARCSEAIEKSNLQTGRKTLYFPSISGSFGTIEEQIQYALKCGIKGVLFSPMTASLDEMSFLSRKYKLIIMAHPSMTGSFFNSPFEGMTPAFMLGKLFRLAGADISVYPNWGGRFPFTKQECLDIAECLREPSSCKRAFPCPAGGMNLGRLNELIQSYGEDTIFLIGGALMRPAADLKLETVKFMNSIKSKFNERLVEPRASFISSCDLSNRPVKTSVADVLVFDNFKWSGRFQEQYKSGNENSFRGITRTELIGKSGEKTKFDLRYFEIEPGGYSSLEKHIHEHVIIGVRGNGILLKENKPFAIKVNDTAYVGPLEPHQLRNESSEVFGFFCIVDHERDKPTSI